MSMAYSQTRHAKPTGFRNLINFLAFIELYLWASYTPSEFKIKNLIDGSQS